MRKLLYIEDESHEPQPFWAGVALLLAGAYQIAVASLRGELFTQTETRQPLSVLDVMRSSRLPTIRLTRRSFALTATHHADGLEVMISRRGAARTRRAGRVRAGTAGRSGNLPHYGAQSL